MINKNNMSKQKVYTNEYHAKNVLRVLRTVVDSDKTDWKESIDWNVVEDEWEQYFGWVENKGIVLGLEIAKNKWGDGCFNDLLEDCEYYKGLVSDFEGDL